MLPIASDSLIRVSTGIEDAADSIADFDQALGAKRGRTP
jgi:O-acetylhomoserine/O-acetylserine sulfhydrylase-like pyridoxal-dependent enzyme